MFEILSICKGGGYKYCRTEPLHPKRNAKGLYPLHRVIVENRLGRLLLSTEDVHHKDEDKSNNTDENLELISHKRHSALHKKVEHIHLKCKCGVDFKLKPSHYRRRVKQNKDGILFCSRSCGAKVFVP